MFGLKDHLRIGISFYECEAFDQAIEHLTKALATKPDDTRIIEMIGDCHNGLRDYNKAIEFYEEALKLQPGISGVLNSLGLVYLKCENFDRAIKNFQAAIEAAPETSVYYKNLQLAIKKRKELFSLKSRQKESPQLYVQRAETFLRHHNYLQAIYNYRKALSLDKDNQDIRNKLKELEKKAARGGDIATSVEIDNKNEKGGGYFSSEEEVLIRHLTELHKLVGLESIKRDVDHLINYIKLNRLRAAQGLNQQTLSLHTIFAGSPGTGKTTVARLLGNIFKSMGILKSGHVTEVDRSGLVAEYVGQTAQKAKAVIDSALDGILFIDEAYSLIKKDSPGDYGREAVEILLKRMEDDKDRLIVIAAGYPEPMKDFLEFNPGLKSRFSRIFHFDDYTPDELEQIFRLQCIEGQFIPEERGMNLLQKYFKSQYELRDGFFGNARLCRNLFEELIKIQANRLSKMQLPTRSDLQALVYEDFFSMLGGKMTTNAENLDELMKELNNLVGLDSIKKEIASLVQYLKVQSLRSSKGLDNQHLTLHSVFYGPPGTGKTTIARLYGRILKAMGILKKGHLVEVSRGDLVGEYLGQTAPKTTAIIQKAVHGVLFIDEAYSLNRRNGIDPYGQEAIDTLLKGMEDNRSQLVVIVAGYSNEMNEFVSSNPGLESRFTRYFYFRSYTPGQLMEIFEFFMNKSGYVIEENALISLQDFLEVNLSLLQDDFGNARWIRNLFERTLQKMSERVALIPEPTDFELNQIIKADLDQGLKSLSSHKFN